MDKLQQMIGLDKLLWYWKKLFILALYDVDTYLYMSSGNNQWEQGAMSGM